MASNPLENHILRNRRPEAVLSGPPVPPKPNATPSLSQRRGLPPPEVPKQLKPLPPVPLPGAIGSKPLPRPPDRIRVGTTVLWIAGFGVWFVLVVVMLPVVMEREAMIGFNAWLRELW